MPECKTKGPDPDRCPTHPGAVLREDSLPALGLSVTAAAKALHVSRQALHNVLAENAVVTPGMSLRLAKLFGGKPDLWLAMQQAHDLWRARRELAAELAAIPELGPAA